MLLPLKKILIKHIQTKTWLWQGVLASKVCQGWKREVGRLFGKTAKKEIRPIQFLDGTLKVEVKNPLFAQELRFKEEEIKKRINKSLKANILKKIIYRVRSF
jgi:predicted nucleic acid-binding Zn ribbon protein